MPKIRDIKASEGRLTYSDYNWRLTKEQINREIKRYAEEKYHPRKPLAIFRDKDSTHIVWIVVEKRR